MNSKISIEFAKDIETAKLSLDDRPLFKKDDNHDIFESNKH